MLKSTCASIAALAVLAFAVDAYAGCGNCGPKDTKEASAAKATSGCCGESCTSEKCAAGSCSSEKCASGTCTAGKCAGGECDAAKGCPITAAMERLPKMTYTVAGKETCCPKEAAKLAEEAKSHFHYCVAGKEFETEPEAQAALIEATEKFVAAFAEPKKCPKSGQLTLAGQAQSCEQTTARLAALMKEAMDGVKLTYVVGEKECGCPNEAAKLAAETGKEKMLCVGEDKTCCEKTARLNLARAKYRAAVEALVKAESELKDTKASPGT